MVEMLLSHFSYFAFIGVLSVYLINTLELNPVYAGTMLLFTNVAAKVVKLLIGPFLGNVNNKSSLIACNALSSLAVLFFYYVKSPMAISFAIFVYISSFTIHSFVVRAIIATVNESASERYKGFANLNVFVSFSSAIGPWLASELLNMDAINWLYFCWGIGFILSIFTLVIIKFDNEKISPDEKTTISVVKEFLTKDALLVYSVVSLGWCTYFFFFSALPLMHDLVFNDSNSLGYIFIINAAIVIFLTKYITKLVSEKSISSIVYLGSTFYFLSFLSMLIVDKTGVFIYSPAILMSIGEVLVIPALFALVTSYFKKEQLLLSLTFTSISIGVGEGISGFIGAHILPTYGVEYFVFTATALLIIKLFCVKQIYTKIANEDEKLA
ncbi:MFS transporter [Vibrio sp. 070316B]|nr:MFS transporter [Vibrio sp. 070316B]